MKAYEQGVLMHEDHTLSAHEIASDYIDTVESNIKLFLKDKPNKMDISLENIKTDFTTFWNNIAAEGELDKALEEWDIQYNAS